MPKVRIRNHEYSLPDISRIVRAPKHETLFMLGVPKGKENYNMVVGIGLVRRIEKGEEFDLVGMDFGSGFIRDIYVKNNHARRQIYTLKKNQYAWFYGVMHFWYDKENNKSTISMFAKAFQGWYVPKNMDIKKLDPGEIEKLTEENESKINFIDELLKGDN